MKQSQWVFAAFVLAVLISVVTFAMNYLGGGRQQVVDPTIRPAREIVFASKVFPPFGILEREEKTDGYIDYWFYNPNEEAVQVGVQHKNCSCASVKVYVLPEDRRAWLARSAVATLGTAQAGALRSLSLLSLAMNHVQKGVEGHELLEKTEKTPVPAGQVGWARLGWSGREGKQTLVAILWFDDPANGKNGILNLALYFHEPLRVRSTLAVGTLSDENLEKGVRKVIFVWSSTRDSLRIEASPALTRDSALSDPFVVGKPEPMSPAEVDKMAETNNEGASATPDTRGSVRCAYRIPILLRAMAADGKTPFDIGPFHRRVHVSSPDVNKDVNKEPKSVLVSGRVLGIIEIGTDEDAGGINFRDFPRNRDKVKSINLECRDRKVELAFDRQRTTSFLEAEVEPVTPPPVGLLQAWTLRAKILPFKADGEFPRSKNPLYEDSAIYLKVTSPGKPPRSVRIPVTGRATGR
jgi:hypothetical protein